MWSLPPLEAGGMGGSFHQNATRVRRKVTPAGMVYIHNWREGGQLLTVLNINCFYYHCRDLVHCSDYIRSGHQSYCKSNRVGWRGESGGEKIILYKIVIVLASYQRHTTGSWAPLCIHTTYILTTYMLLHKSEAVMENSQTDAKLVQSALSFGPNQTAAKVVGA